MVLWEPYQQQPGYQLCSCLFWWWHGRDQIGLNLWWLVTNPNVCFWCINRMKTPVADSLTRRLKKAFPYLLLDTRPSLWFKRHTNYLYGLLLCSWGEITRQQCFVAHSSRKKDQPDSITSIPSNCLTPDSQPQLCLGNKVMWGCGRNEGMFSLVGMLKIAKKKAILRIYVIFMIFSNTNFITIGRIQST